MSTKRERSEGLVTDDRPSNARVAGFLDGLEENRRAARRTRWVGLGVGAVITAVVYLTAVGVVPVEAEGLVISASAIVAGFALGKT